VWVYCFFAAIVRPDKGVGWRLGWVLFILLLPPIGIVAS